MSDEYLQLEVYRSLGRTRLLCRACFLECEVVGKDLATCFVNIPCNRDLMDASVDGIIRLCEQRKKADEDSDETRGPQGPQQVPQGRLRAGQGDQGPGKGDETAD